MTLHEAMKEAIKDAGNPLPASDIAQYINENHLYYRSDNKLVPSSQISARARKYIGMFRVVNGLIYLN